MLFVPDKQIDFKVLWTGYLTLLQRKWLFKLRSNMEKIEDSETGVPITKTWVPLLSVNNLNGINVINMKAQSKN